MSQDTELIKRLYKSMLLIRRVEEKIAEVYHTDVVKSPVHLSIGQESVAVGACDGLKKDDVVANTYRCHAGYLAKGGDLNQMIAELYGKIGGCAKGKAGSMHLIDMPNGVMGASAVVGTTVPVSAGYAWALKQDAKKIGKQRVVLSFFGDGATEEGSFSETLNFAALKKLPMVFLCENNNLAIHTHIEKRWATDRIRERVAAYDIPTFKVDDGDVFKIRDAVTQAAETARSGKGPAFVECKTYRWREHVGPGEDLQEDYRDMEEFERWKENDQVKKLGEMLENSEKEEIDNKVEDLINKSVEFAENSPFPDKEELFSNVYAA